MMMTRSIWFVILVAVIILVLFLALFFQPLFFRRNFIDGVVRLEIPRTAQIIDYRVGASRWGVAPFFAKLELSQEDYETWARHFYREEDYLWLFNRMQQAFNYESTSVDDIVGIGHVDRLTRRTSIVLLAGSSRSRHALFVTTNDGRHFVYVFYFH